VKISEAINEFVAYQYSRRGDDSSTANGYKTTLNQFLRFTGDKECASLTERHVEDWFYGPHGLMNEHEVYAGSRNPKQQPGLSPGGHNLYRTRMIVWVKWCMQRGYIRRDPTWTQASSTS
jgi:site-specific recombinase XerD